jgi:hypothetical protein
VTFTDVRSGHNPLPIFDLDETQLMARNRFNVLTGAGNFPLMKLEAKFPHITRVCNISVTEIAFRPIIILKQLMNIKSLISSPQLASFASFTSGWITTDLFTMFAIDFGAQLSHY